MSTANPFERPRVDAPQNPSGEPDKQKQERAERINREVDKYLASGLYHSAQDAANYVIENEQLLDRDYRENFGNIAEAAMERILGDVLGNDRVVDAPTPEDLLKPRPNESAAGKAQADFFLMLDPVKRDALAVQMFLRRFGRTDSTQGDRAVIWNELAPAFSQAFRRTADGRIIPLTLFHADTNLFARIVREWESEGKKGGPEDFLTHREKVAATRTALERMNAFLDAQIRYQRDSYREYDSDKPKLLAAYRHAKDVLETFVANLEETKTAGRANATRGRPAAEPVKPDRPAPSRPGRR